MSIALFSGMGMGVMRQRNPESDSNKATRSGLFTCLALQLGQAVRSHMPTGEFINAAGKIINSVKLEFEYAELRKETPVIDFLGGLKTPEERSISMQSSVDTPPKLP